MRQRTAEPSQRPTEYDTDLALGGILHQTVRLGPASLTATTTGIRVFPGRFPSSALTLFLQFSQLHLTF
jgi:hypothetical protein